MVIYNIHQIIYNINQITLGGMKIENMVDQPPQLARRQQGKIYRQGGQVIWKIQKGRLTINIVNWHFSQLVWNRPCSSACGKAPAHLKNSKRED